MKIYMNEFEINDIRNDKQFKSITFSKFKRTDAKKALLTSIFNGKIEYALNWSAEFICCGCFIELWDIILNFVGKFIHLGNPKLPIYLELRFNKFKEIAHTYSGNELDMRNNIKVRELFAEIITVLCNSNKKLAIESVKIKTIEEFDMTTISSKLKAPNIKYASEIFCKDDPKELFIAINEFAYHVSKDSLNSLQACYWYEWILEFENLCKKKKELCLCERRLFVTVEEKYQKEPIWIIWDILFKICNNKTCKISKKVMESLFSLFCIRYTSGCKRKRKYLIYFAIFILTENVNYNKEIIENKAIIDEVTKKINLIYKVIKQNEEAPATNYLFSGIETSSKEKSFKKLEQMNNINTIIRTGFD